MKSLTAIVKRIILFYTEGFRNMTWGRVLWVIILLKLFILFAILRLFFFQPVLKNMTEEEKQEAVARELTR